MKRCPPQRVRPENRPGQHYSISADTVFPPCCQARRAVESAVMKFYELAVGARYVFRGRRFEKTAMSMANDEKRCGRIFMGETEVTPDGVPFLLPLEEAAKWKPDERHWTEYLTPRARAKGTEAGSTGRCQAGRLACFIGARMKRRTLQRIRADKQPEHHHNPKSGDSKSWPELRAPDFVEACRCK
jgi:hypothetical protein